LKRYERRIEDKNYFILIMKVIIDIAVAVGVAVFLFMYFGDTVIVSGYSMEPALANNDKIMLDKFTYSLADIERFDVVVFSADDDKGEYVKRIIGMPGERIQIKNGKVYIDGKVLRDDIKNADSILNAGIVEEEMLLGEDEYFVLGDNRNNSEDSRFESIGNISRDDIIGKAWLKVTGLDNFGLIE